MDKIEFYKLYLPALKKALDEDDGIQLKDPEEYIENPLIAKSITWYIEIEDNDPFLDMVAYYYDARVHNFPDMGKWSIEEGRNHILLKMKELASEFNVSLK